MKWEKVKLGDFCSIKSSKRIFYDEYSEFGVPFYRSKEIIELYNGHQISEKLYISSERYQTILEKFGVPSMGDLLLTSVGTIGIPYVVKGSDKFYFKDGNLTWFSHFSGKLSSQYLFYWFVSSEGQGLLYNSVIGSSQKALTIDLLKKLQIPLPPLPIQRRIVDILSAYDDLIENNRKQIKLLEEAAQRLYKEWFIDLRFPGHEKIKITDGVPEGWERKRAKDFYNITIGRTPDRKHQEWYSCTEGVKWVSISDMCNGIYLFDTKEKLTEDAVRSNNVKMLSVGTVLLSFKLTIGRVSISSVPLYSNEAIAHFYTDDVNFRIYTYLYLENFDYETLGSTSGIGKAINSTIVKNMPFVKPRGEVLENFGRIENNYFNQICHKEKQIKLLQEARDRLLPKLMNGEIEV